MPPDIESLFATLSIEITRYSDDEIHACCPSKDHDDKHPSWSMNRFTGEHHCFSCGYQGGLISLIMERQDIGMWEAMDWMASLGITSDAVQKIHERKSAPPVRPAYMLDSVLNDFADPPAAELERRGLSLDACDQFSIRWDPDDEAWVLPIRTEHGELLGWQLKGRNWVSNYPKSIKKAHSLFGLSEYIESRQGGPLVLVESPLDVARMWMAGIWGGVSSYGVSVSDAQMELCVRHSEDLILALDNDEHGVTMTTQLVKGERTDTRGRTQKAIYWAGKIRVKLYYYGDSKAKDPGEQTDEEIHAGVEQAVAAVAVSV